MPTQHRNDIRYYDYLELFFKQSEDAIAVFDMDNKLLTCNPAFEKLYGWTLEECIHHPIQFFPEAEMELVKQRRLLLERGNTLSIVQVTEKRKNGTLFQAEITMTPIFNEHEEVVAISNITREITSRLQLEQKRLEIENLRTISAIAASVAHEIRNPMTTITGFVQLMNRDPANNYAPFTKIMEKEINSVNQIVTDFLVMAQPRIKEKKSFSLLKSIQEVIDAHKETLNKKNITCHFHAEEKSFPLLGDIESLKTVFSHILSNCYDALKPYGTIDISLQRAEDTVSISIEDNGCGMSEIDLNNCFQPFFSTKEHGKGLGLTLSKKIILDHKGTLKIDSLQNSWTTVTISLPLANKTLH